MTPNPINALQITIYTTKHTTNTQIYSTIQNVRKCSKPKPFKNKIVRKRFYYISNCHNTCFVYFVYWVYFVYFPYNVLYLYFFTTNVISIDIP